MKSPLLSRRSCEPWVIDADMSHRELVEARRVPRPAESWELEEETFLEDLEHIRGHGITHPEALASRLGLTFDAYEQRLIRISQRNGKN